MISITRLLAVGLLVLPVLTQPAAAQQDDLLTDLQDDFSARAERWSATLREAEVYLEQEQHAAQETQRYADQVREVGAAAGKARDRLHKDVESGQRLLDALGEPPPQGGPAEPEVLRKRRDTYADRLGELRARLARAELILTRAEELHEELVQLRLKVLRDRLLTRLPLPWSPSVLAAAVREFGDKVVILARSPLDWYSALGEAERRRAFQFPVVAFLVVAVALGGLAGRFLVRRFGRRHDVEEPAYSRRVVAAIAEGVGRGAIPALFIAACFVWTLHAPVALTPLLEQVVLGLLLVLFFFVLAVTLPRAVLAPHFPQWQVLDVPDESAALLSRDVSLLAGILAFDIFFLYSVHELQVSDELRSVFYTFFSLVEGAGAIWLARDRLWAPPAEPAGQEGESTGVVGQRCADHADEDKPEEQEPLKSRSWRWVRRAVVLLAGAGMVAALIGYGRLGIFLVHNLLISALLIGLLAVLRGLLREGVGLLEHSDGLRRRLGVRDRTMRRLRIWVIAVGDPLVFALGALGLLALWGFPVDELFATARELLSGFKVGNVTISPAGILLAAIVFAIALALVRLFRRRLLAPLLAETTLHESVQQSISTGAGYLGVVVAAGLAVAALGIGLSNIALIAGALSVGIGFGLQNIVNNFVSGIILLMERPIKVGDWVVVGTFEGFVKEINMRATELETFQRASVIIPNAEIISSSVTNWTHKDRYGRVEVRVGVAYGTDPAKVRDILLECAREHPMVVVHPVTMVLFAEFDDSALVFELRCFTRDVVWKLNIASELRYEIYRRFNEAGIEIPFPQRVVTLRSRETMAPEELAGGGEEADEPQRRARPAGAAPANGGDVR